MEFTIAVAAKAFEKELVSKFKRLDAELCKRDDKLAKHARKVRHDLLYTVA